MGADDFEAFFLMSPDMLAIAGTSGRLERVNPAWNRTLGWSEAELTSQPFLEFVHPDDRAATVREAELVYAGHATAGFRNRYRARDGRYHWLEWSTRAALDGRLYSVARDVTAQREAARRLEEGEARFRRLAENSLEGIVVERIQRDFQPLFVNATAAAMFGFDSVAEVMALPSLTSLAPPESLEMARQSWPLLAAGQLPTVKGRVEMLRRDGRPIIVELMGSAIPWEGEPAFQMTIIDVTERVRLEAELTRMATTDELTGLYNRHRFGELAGHELRRLSRHPAPLSLLVIDADHFKTINDRFGHSSGDEVITALGATLRRSVREVDFVCRWGGEEFVALLIGASATGAAVVAERIRANCAALVVEHGGQKIQFTVSVGIAERRPDERELEPIVARADAALYAAKAAGRNRVAKG